MATVTVFAHHRYRPPVVQDYWLCVACGANLSLLVRKQQTTTENEVIAKNDVQATGGFQQLFIQPRANLAMPTVPACVSLQRCQIAVGISQQTF